VLDQVAVSLIETSAAHLAVGARQPDERLRAALAAANARFVVALDDPRVTVADAPCTKQWTCVFPQPARE
jgi:hypothetical protein